MPTDHNPAPRAGTGGDGGDRGGLQPERTTLAWRRTASALAVAALVIGRLTTTDLGPPAVALAAAAAALATGTVLATWRRRRLAGPPGAAAMLHDGKAPAALAAAIALLCVVELAALTLGPAS